MTNKILVFALLAFGVLMLIIGLLFGVGYWTVDSPAARWLLLAAGIGGALYIFSFVKRATE